MKLKSIEPIISRMEYQWDCPVMRLFFNCQISQSESVYLQVSHDDSNLLSIDLDSTYLFISEVEIITFTGLLGKYEPIKCPERVGMPFFQNLWDRKKQNGRYYKMSSPFSLAIDDATFEIRVSNHPDAMLVRSGEQLFFTFDARNHLNKIIFPNIPNEYIAQIRNKWGEKPTTFVKF